MPYKRGRLLADENAVSPIGTGLPSIKQGHLRGTGEDPEFSHKAPLFDIPCVCAEAYSPLTPEAVGIIEPCCLGIEKETTVVVFRKEGTVKNFRALSTKLIGSQE